MKYIKQFTAIIIVLCALTIFGMSGVSAQTPDDGVTTVGSTNTSAEGVDTRGRTSDPGTLETRNVTTKSNTFYLSNPLKFNSVGDVIGGFLEIFVYLAVLVGVLLLIWVGFQFVLAQGNSERMKELKTWLLWIVVGLAIVIGARIIVKIVINTLEATNSVDSGIITNANRALRTTNP